MDSAEPITVREAKLQALRLASKLAESQESPLAVDQWNAACRRISKLIAAEIRKLELEKQAGGRHRQDQVDKRFAPTIAPVDEA